MQMLKWSLSSLLLMNPRQNTGSWKRFVEIYNIEKCDWRCWAENRLNISSFAIILQDFEAFKEHSTNLLIQERELNKKLRHMMG